MPIQRPAGYNLTEDYRDPAIFMGPDGRYQMVVGSRDSNGGVMLLYGTEDPLGLNIYYSNNCLIFIL